MAEFKVSTIIDGDTFDVNPTWVWNGYEGSRIRPTGYDAPEMNTLAGIAAKDKLQRLILGKNITLGAAYKLDHNRLVCDVYYNGKNLADYFPEYK
jgi:endonuclease YncB( thermonuclease family)